MQSLIGPIRDDENNIIVDDVVKAEARNDYFTAIGLTLASKINSAEGFIIMTHLYKVSSLISEVPFYEDKLFKRLSTINPSKTSGPDSISPRDFHLLGQPMMNGLYIVFKRSLKESTVPTQWKISRMHTIYKKGNASDRGNYRPLQMLSVPSKLLESIVCKGLDEFIADTGL